MNWRIFHKQSEEYAVRGHLLMQENDEVGAMEEFYQAAIWETKALDCLSNKNPKTYGITAISASALYYKAGRLLEAENIILNTLAKKREIDIPQYSIDQLRTILQTIWNSGEQGNDGFSFSKSQIVISVKGGRVLRGGAPLELVLQKMKFIQSLFYRVAEFSNSFPLRKSGPPPEEIKTNYNPWIFQQAPSSYQFALVIEKKPQQIHLFGEKPAKLSSDEVSKILLKVLNQVSSDPETGLNELVPDDYRSTILQISKNIAPSNDSFERIEFKSESDSKPVALTRLTYEEIGKVVSNKKRVIFSEDGKVETDTIVGNLRGVHIDKDWIELLVNGKNIRIHQVGESADDIIGPMVNHDVKVKVIIKKDNYYFEDIEMVS